jgi:hypothetical protein
VQKDSALILLWHFMYVVQIVRRGTLGWLEMKPAVDECYTTTGRPRRRTDVLGGQTGRPHGQETQHSQHTAQDTRMGSVNDRQTPYDSGQQPTNEIHLSSFAPES